MPNLSSTCLEWCSWSWAEYRAGRAQHAKTGYGHALAIDATSIPAQFGLATVLLETGDLLQAVELSARLAKTAPDRMDILWLQARVSMAEGDANKTCTILMHLLQNAQLTLEQRAEALLLLGLAYGDLARNADAFRAAREGKQLQRELFAREAFQREDEIVKLRRLGDWINDVRIDWPPGHQPIDRTAARGHVFLIGFPRSGTTLLEQILAAHSQICTLEEAPTLATAYQAFLSDALACAALLRVSPEEAAAWTDHYWEHVRNLGVDPTGKVFVDKQPAGTLNLPIIARLFPNAKILFAVRDPRDVVLSCFRQAFEINAMTYTFTDLTKTAECYDACMLLAERARDRMPLAWTDVRHEALLTDFAGELARILAFLGVDYQSEMANFATVAKGRAIRTPSATQVRAGLNQRGLRRWQAYRSELEPVLPMLAPWIGRFGYAL